MKRARKLLCVLMALCLLVYGLPLSASAATSGKCGDKVTWSFDSASGTLTISGTGAMEDFYFEYTNMGIPSPWSNYYEKLEDSIEKIIVKKGVTSIGAYAFWDCENLVSVSLPDTITSIGGCAFSYCSRLTSIHIPKNVESVGEIFDDAFCDCDGLKKFTVDSANTHFSAVDGVLFDKAKKVLISYPSGKGASYSIPVGTTKIGTCAFLGSTITSVSIPNTVTSIGLFSFTRSKLKTISLPASVTELVPSTFNECPDLTAIKVDKANKTYSSVDGVLFSKDKKQLLKFPTAKASEYIVPNGTTSIEDDAFDCTNLHSVTIPKSVTFIKWATFYNRPNDFVLKGISGSYAETFAKDNKIAFEAVSSTEKPAEPLPTQFKDVPAGAYYVEPVKWAVENGVTSGVSSTKFGPNESCTRAQFVAFLWRAAGKPEPASSSNPFVDVPQDYYTKAVLWASEKGIVFGTDDTHFSPNKPVQRAQAVTFLYRYAGKPTVEGSNKFTDVKSGDYYKNAVIWGEKNGIVFGTGDTTFSPLKTCVRAQTVTFLYRYCK